MRLISVYLPKAVSYGILVFATEKLQSIGGTPFYGI